MQRTIVVLGKIGDGIERVLDIIVFALTFSSIWLFCFLVFMRYAVGHAYDWGDELVQVIIVIAMVLAAAGAAREGGHTTIDYIPSKLGGRRSLILLTGGYAISVIVCLFLVWTGVTIMTYLAAERLSSTSSLPIPEWLDHASLPVALLCAAFYYLEKVVSNTHKLRSGAGASRAL